MTCEDAIGQLYEYLDQELDRRNYTKIERHLGTCHVCSEKYEFERALKNVIKVKTQVHKISESVRESIAVQLSARHRVQELSGSSMLKSGESRRKGIFQFLFLRPAYIAAAVFLPLLISGITAYMVFFKSTGFSFPLIERVAEHHDQFVSSKDFLDLSSVDLSELKKYFKDTPKVNFVMDTSGKNKSVTPFGALTGGRAHAGGYEIKLLGGKNYNLAGRKSMYIGLEKMPAKISLEIVDSAGIQIRGLKMERFGGRPFYSGKRRGYNIVIWKNGKKLFSLTSTINKKELMRVANRTLCSSSE